MIFCTNDANTICVRKTNKTQLNCRCNLVGKQMREKRHSAENHFENCSVCSSMLIVYGLDHTKWSSSIVVC